MASLIKVRGSFYAQFYHAEQAPKRKQIPLGTKTKQVAQRLLRRLEDDYALGTFDPWSTNAESQGSETVRLTTLGPAVAAFHAEKAHLRASSREHYRRYLGWLTEDLGADQALKAITAQHLRDYLQRTEIRDVTRATYLRHVRVFFRWILSQGYVKTDVSALVKLPRLPERTPGFLTPEDFRDLLAMLGKGRKKWLADVVEATAYLGLRLGEVCALRWEHVDMEARRLRVRNEGDFLTKSGRERTLPIASPALAVLQRLRSQHQGQAATGYVFSYRRGAKMDPTYVSHLFCLSRRAAGLPEGVCFHSLRHTAASWLMMNGASIEAIRLYLGHSSVTVTQKYAHLAPDAYRDQISAALDRI